MTGDAATTAGTGSDGVTHLRQPGPTLVSRGFEGLVLGPLEVQELPAPIRDLFEQAVPTRLRQIPILT